MRTVPFLDLQALHGEIHDELKEAFARVLESGWFVMGPELERFEHDFAQYCDVKYCIGVGNGLDAIRLLLQAYGIGPGDEVIVPSNTFIATWLAVSECGATPVAVEPDEMTHNLDTDKLGDAVSGRTKAVIPVHMYGQPADMDGVLEFAERHGLVVIEDAAQAQGARYKGRRACSLGHAAATSFYPGKNLGALGDGGAVLTNDAVIADKVRMLRNYGSSEKYKHDLAGCNSRLDEMQAALLRVKLPRMDEWNQRRWKLASLYTEKLQGLDMILPAVPEWAEPVWHLYVVRSRERDALIAHLNDNGVSTGVHYPVPPHLQPCYTEYASLKLPLALELSREVLSLPMSPVMTPDDVDFVAETIRRGL